MKQVEITSKVVGRGESEGFTSAIPSINLSGFALKSDLLTLEKKFSDFFNVPIIDGTINRWNELETFLAGISEDYNLLSLLNGKADKSYVDTNFVTIAGTEDVTGLHNFVNGLKVGGIELIQKNGNAFLKGNLVVEGGITMYGDGEGGSSVPLYSTLGSLLNVDESNDAVASVDRVLFQSAGSNVWSWKALSEIGGGSSGGSVSGDYLPLSGGTLTGNLTLGNSSNTSHIGYYINRSGNSIGLAPDYNCACLRFATSTSNTNFLRLANGALDLSYDGGTNWNNILHSGNYSSYALPLSGGVLTSTNAAVLELKNNTTNTAVTFSGTTNKMAIGVITSDNGGYGYINVKDVNNVSLSQLWVEKDVVSFYLPSGNIKHTVLHDGNISNYNSGSANRINAYQHNSDDKIIISGSRTDNTFPRKLVDNGYGLVIERYETGNVKIRNYIATLSDNVASATKLQTARTIWGQSFDGTGNVSGDIYLNNSNFIRVADTSGTSRKILTLDYGNNVVLGYHTADASYDTYIDGLNIHIRSGKHNEVIHIKSSGNVGIGTTSPAYKLDVNGYVRASKHFILGNAQIYDTNVNSISMPYSTYIAFGGHIALRGEEVGIVLVAPSASGGSIIFRPTGNTDTSKQTVIDKSGNMLVSGGITMYSDQRKKTILNHVELSLKQIADAPLIEHYYNSDQEKTTHVGSIAQYWAGLNDWFCKLDAEGFYTMEIQNCALASAISIARHLEKYESKTDKTIRKMKQRIQELEDEVERLKKGA